MRTTVLIFLFIFFSVRLHAQFELLLLDGRQIVTKELTQFDSLNIYSYKTVKGKTKILEQDFIYSVKNPQGIISVVYQPNELSYNYQADEMLEFIKGEQAVKQYIPYLSTALSFGIATGTSLAFPEQGINVFYSSFVPLGYTGLTLLFPGHFGKVAVPNDCLHPEVYKAGYANKALKKRFVYSLAGTIIGMGVGLGVNAIKMK
jgi:hypothetical protein